MKRMVILLGVFCLFLLQIGNTYAVFESDVMGESKVKTAKWVIRVNDGDLGKSQTFNIDNLAFIGNDLVKEGKFAPNTEGYFDIVIDAEEVEVSLRYDIEFDFSSLSIPGLVISSITELGGNTLVLTDKDTYSGVITLADMDSSTVNTVRVSISWQNDEANNEVDSSWGMVADKVISIPVNVKLTQYLGEELPVYVE